MSEIRFVDRGFRDTILLVPGWATDHRIFDALDLELNYLIPLGPSHLDLEKSVLSEMAKNRLGKISMLGWSLGGLRAFDLLLNHRDNFDTAIFVGVKLRYQAGVIEEAKRRLKRNKAAFLRKFYHDCFSEYEARELAWFRERFMQDYIDHSDLGSLVDGLDYLSDNEITPSGLKGVKVRFIHGMQDRIAPAGEIMGLEDDLPEAEFSYIEKAGHMAFLNPDFKKVFDNGRDL